METWSLLLDFISCNNVKFYSTPASILIQNLMMFSSMFNLNTNFSQCNHSLGHSVRAGLSCLQRLSIMIENQDERKMPKIKDNFHFLFPKRKETLFVSDVASPHVLDVIVIWCIGFDVPECIPVFLSFRCICQSCLPQIFVDQTNILAADRGGYFGR